MTDSLSSQSHKAKSCEHAQTLLMELAMALPQAQPECLPVQEQAFLDQHLRHCADCLTYERSLKQLTLSLQNLEPVSAPKELADKIFQTIEMENSNHPVSLPLKTKQRHFFKQPWVRPLLAVASTLLLLALVIPLLPNEQSPSLDTVDTVNAIPEQSSPSQESPKTLTPMATAPQQAQPNPEAQSPRLRAVHVSLATKKTNVIQVSQPESLSDSSELLSDAEDTVWHTDNGNSGEPEFDPVGNLVGF